MAAVTDPSGAAFRLWQPLEAAGFEMVGEAGAPVWHQLETRGPSSRNRLFREVFGWHTKQVVDSDEFRYVTASFNDQPLLGIADREKSLPDGVQPSGAPLRHRGPRQDVEEITETGGTWSSRLRTPLTVDSRPRPIRQA